VRVVGIVIGVLLGLVMSVILFPQSAFGQVNIFADLSGSPCAARASSALQQTYKINRKKSYLIIFSLQSALGLAHLVAIGRRFVIHEPFCDSRA